MDTLAVGFDNESTVKVLVRQQLEFAVYLIIGIKDLTTMLQQLEVFFGKAETLTDLSVRCTAIFNDSTASSTQNTRPESRQGQQLECKGLVFESATVTAAFADSTRMAFGFNPQQHLDSTKVDDSTTTQEQLLGFTVLVLAPVLASLGTLEALLSARFDCSCGALTWTTTGTPMACLPRSHTRLALALGTRLGFDFDCDQEMCALYISVVAIVA